MSGLLGKGGGKGMLGKMNQALSEGILKIRVPFIRQGFAYIFKLLFHHVSCVIGLAKIFGEKSAKPHGGNWVKT